MIYAYIYIYILYAYIEYLHVNCRRRRWNRIPRFAPVTSINTVQYIRDLHKYDALYIGRQLQSRPPIHMWLSCSCIVHTVPYTKSCHAHLPLDHVVCNSRFTRFVFCKKIRLRIFITGSVFPHSATWRPCDRRAPMQRRALASGAH